MRGGCSEGMEQYGKIQIQILFYSLWPVVFRLNDFSADYAVNGTYDKVCYLEPGDF